MYQICAQRNLNNTKSRGQPTQSDEGDTMAYVYVDATPSGRQKTRVAAGIT